MIHILNYQECYAMIYCKTFKEGGMIEEIRQTIYRQAIDAEEKWLLDSVSELVGDEAPLLERLYDTLKENPSSKVAFNAMKSFLDKHKLAIAKAPDRAGGTLSWRPFNTLILKDGVVVRRMYE